MAFVNLSSARLIANSQSKVALKICKCQQCLPKIERVKTQMQHIHIKSAISTGFMTVFSNVILWLYKACLELNFQDLPPLLLLQQHGKINFVNVPTYFYSPKVNTIFKWCCVAHYNVIKNVKSKHVTHLSFSYNLQKSILL